MYVTASDLYENVRMFVFSACIVYELMYIHFQDRETTIALSHFGQPSPISTCGGDTVVNCSRYLGNSAWANWQIMTSQPLGLRQTVVQKHFLEWPTRLRNFLVLMKRILNIIFSQLIRQMLHPIPTTWGDSVDMQLTCMGSCTDGLAYFNRRSKNIKKQKFVR